MAAKRKEKQQHTTTKALLTRLTQLEPVTVTLYKEDDVAKRARLAAIIARHWGSLPDEVQEEIRALMGRKL